MRIQVQQVNVPLDYDDALVLQRTSRKLRCAPSALSGLRIVRRSLDARPRNPAPQYVLTIETDIAPTALPAPGSVPGIERVDEAVQVPRTAGPSSFARATEDRTGPLIPVAVHLPVTPQRAHSPRCTSTTHPRPVIVGAGPAGLMAAYKLAIAGARPLLIERGDDALARAPKVARFWNEGILDPESNVLYGEGGAGLFSDGKLTARSKERGRIREFMTLLHALGAGESVLIDAEPHLGSDLLLDLVPRLRNRIIEAGGEVRFVTRLEGIIRDQDRLQALIINGQEIACGHCVLAVGHSARDVYEMLAGKGVHLTPKPFAVGIRLELPQSAIDRAQYGRFAGSPQLGAASFRLTRREEAGVRSCYSFCMCPGGKVISCASEPGMLTTNGMSYSKRSLSKGNAAFLVPVGPSDYPEHPIPALAGVEFQRTLERDAFTAAGGRYGVAAVRLADFLAKRVPSSLPDGGSCPHATPLEFRTILPEFVTHTLERSIPAMLKELNGVKLDEVALYAPETRSSSPLWITRNPEGESMNTAGLFPVGEGAGYAGGIVSSALDGMRAAEHILQVL